jgi:hypothetical protein
MAMATKDQLKTVDAQVKLLSLSIEDADKQHNAARDDFHSKLQMLELGQADKIKLLAETEKTLRLNQLARHRVKVEGNLGRKKSLSEEAQEHKLEKSAQISSQLAKYKADLSKITMKCEEDFRQLQEGRQEKLQEVKNKIFPNAVCK